MDRKTLTRRQQPGRMRRFAAAVAALVTLSVSGVGSAEEIEQIVVVAHKDSRSIRTVAANVTALTRSQLKDEMAASVDDAFRYVPGIDAESAGGRFGAEAINIRGIGGNRVTTLIDGVPLSDQFDIGSFSNATRDFIDAGLIERIEVLHGPASAVYGSSAIGGVIDVRTPDPVDLDAGEALLTWRGNDASVQGQAMLAAGDRERGILLGASWRNGQQLESAAAGADRDRYDYERRTLLGKFVANDRRGGTWRASLIVQDAATASDMHSLLGTGRFRATTALVGDDRSRTNIASLAYAFGQPGGLYDAAVARAYYRDTAVEQLTLDERGNATTPVRIDRLFSFDQETQGAELNFFKRIVGARVTHRIGFGLEYRGHETVEYRDGRQTTLATGEHSNIVLGEEFPLRDFPVSRTTEIAAYAEDSVTLGNWIAIAALRFDRFDLDPRPDPVYVTAFPSTDPVGLNESDVSPKLGMIYQVSPAVDVYAQYARGFRAPPYSDANIGLDIPLFNVRAIANPDLRSETSDGFELGLRMLGEDVDARVALFHTRYEDFIETKVRLGIDPDSGRLLFQSRNLRAATIEGAEATASVYFGGERRPLRLDVAAYYATGTNRESDAPINSVGPPQAVVGLAWRSADERRHLHLKATFTDDASNLDESGGALFQPPGYAVFDAFFFQQVGDSLSIRAGLHNLTDRTYWRWADVRGLSPDDPVLPYLARAGRSVSLSMNFNW